MKWVKRGSFGSLGELLSARDPGPEQDLPVKGLQEAADMIKDHALRFGADTITIVGDYDADGIVSTVNLSLSIYSRFRARPGVLFPRRFSDGYGLNEAMVDRIEAKLLVTVDNGITAVDAIRKAKERGMKVIVIDHHQMRDDGLLPPADIIVDPHVFRGPFDGYCAAGLTFKLACMLTVDLELIKKLLVLTGIATVADVVPLLSENRLLVKRSLALINEGKGTTGLRLLLSGRERVTDVDYGFFLGPVFNAAGRLYDTGAMVVYNVLSYDGEVWDKLQMAADFLLNVNKTRKEITSLEAEKALQDLPLTDGPIILTLPELSEGLVGIVAGRIAEERKRPAIVLTQKGPGLLKGSGRSAGDFDLKKALDKCAPFLQGYGGHKGAAGLSLKESDLEGFRKAFGQTAEGFAFPDPDCIFYDADVEPEEMGEALMQLEQGGPYGEAFERPLVRTAFEAVYRYGGFYKLMGKDMKDVKVYGDGFDLVMFGMAQRFQEEGCPRRIEAVGELSYNFFNGNAYIQLRAQDFRSLQEDAAGDDLRRLLDFT